MPPVGDVPGQGEDRSRTRTRLKGVGAIDAPASTSVPKAIGRYEVLDVIGRGAMGVVYKARDPLLDRIVAVKTIHTPAGASKNVRKAFLDRFEREAKAAARISHPAIVTIFDVGLAEELPFLVMEYLPGETLADRLDRQRMPVSQAIQCARDLASALGHAHRERIVHRDVKPANVLHAGEGRWKLTDFGIARLPDSDLTQIGMFMGTPGYAPPEAIREGRYTAQADVFAWGAVLYELLCGRVPYEGPDTQTTNGYVLRGDLMSPKDHDPRIPEPLAEIVLRALSPDTGKRFKNGSEADQALGEAWELSLVSGLVQPSTQRAPEPSPRAVGATPALGNSAARRNNDVRDDAPTMVADRPAKDPRRKEPATPSRDLDGDRTIPRERIEASGARPALRSPPAAPVLIESKSKQRGDGAQKVPTESGVFDVDDAEAKTRVNVPGYTRTQVVDPARSRLWVAVAVALSVVAVAAVVVFYLVRG